MNRYYVTIIEPYDSSFNVTLTSAVFPWDHVCPLGNGKAVEIHPEGTADTIRHLADLLDGVLADDPQAIRDATAWLTVNRPAVTVGDGVGVRWLDTDTVGEGER